MVEKGVFEVAKTETELDEGGYRKSLWILTAFVA